jgi:hypothetical protein
MANYIQFLMPMVREREKLLGENHTIQQIIAVKEQMVVLREQMIVEKDRTIAALLQCSSMRITKPIRVISNFLRSLRTFKHKPAEFLSR